MQTLKPFLALTVFAILSANTISLNAAECSAKSGQSRVALLELYTSEGCSSCPPADKWLSYLPQQGIDSSQLVPLSMHVDYWNYIGWKDPYSAPEYTQRQREIAQRNQLRSIYTPQMVFNGRDYRGWRRQDVKQLLKEVNAWPAAANLQLNWQSTIENKLSLTVNATLLGKPKSNPILYAALYENELISNVSAGENDGRKLKHDYVVREMLAIPFAGNKQLEKQISFDIESDWQHKNLGVALFVQQRATGEVLQAMSSPILCSS